MLDKAENEGRRVNVSRGVIQVKLEGPPPGPPFTPTAPNMFKFVRETHGPREFLVFGDLRLTYADADRRSRELAKGLLAMGLGKGSRVGLLMPNDPDWVVTWMACARIGAHTIALSTFYQASEIAWAVRHNDIQVLLTINKYLKADYVERLERGLTGLAQAKGPDLLLADQPHLRRVVVWGDCDRPWALRGPDAILAAAAAEPRIDDNFLDRIEASINPSDPIVTICTSGTTSAPKAVVHSNGAFFRAIFQFCDYFDSRPDDRMYPAMPFFWIGGLNTSLVPAMYLGACLCFARTPDPLDVIEVAKRESVNVIHHWPVQAKRLALALEETGQELPLVRIGIGPQLDASDQRVIPPDRLASGPLGMTETMGMHSMDRFDAPVPAGKAGANGRKMTGVERLVVDADTRKPLPPGERGLLFVRSYNMMLGYYGKERWETFTRDGFFPTGDMAVIDEESFIWFRGRDGDMIKTSGANVSPQEVEAALLACDGVREAIVFSIPDEAKGEAVIAVVAAAPGSELDPEGLRKELRETISPYKVPQSISVLTYEDIPRTASGKAIKHKLRELLYPGMDV